MPTGKKLPPGSLTRAIGRVLSEAAETQGLSQAHLGRQNAGTPMFISQPHISRFFDGSKGIDLDQLGGICRTLGLGLVEVIQAGQRLVAAAESAGRVRSIRTGVGGYLDDAVHGLDTAAGTDETQADDD